MKILIICAGGMSSSIVTKKTREAALRRGDGIQVDESATFDIDNKKNEYDIFLVAPQVKYLVPNLINQVSGKPVGLIPPTDYARMDGEKIINFALSLVKE